MAADQEQQCEHDEAYEAPRVRALGSIHELTQGGFPGFPGFPPGGPGGPPGRWSW
jgi:hypothetical protein